MNLKQKRDQRTSKAVAKKYENMCVWCGQEGSDHAHIIPRRFLLTRWLLKNGLWMCRKHHQLFDQKNLSGKKFRKHIINTIVGEENYMNLCMIKDEKRKAIDFEYIEIE